MANKLLWRPKKATSPRFADSTAIHSITSAKVSASVDQHRRARTYFISMMIRTASFILAIFLPNPWRWCAIAAAVVLPYASVVMANTVSQRPNSETPFFTPRKKQLGN